MIGFFSGWRLWMNHLGDYLELVRGIICLYREYGRVYTVTSTGRRYRLKPKIVGVEAGSSLRYTVELYDVPSDIDPRKVVSLVLAGYMRGKWLEGHVELYIERENKNWSMIEAYPPLLFYGDELFELIKAIRVDGMRCREVNG